MYQAALAAHGMTPTPPWEQYASQQHPWCAEQAMHLLFSAPARHRPDGLILADDHFVGGALAGIAASGAAEPANLSIIALTNFPNVLPATLPVVRLGYDVPALVDLLVTRLEQLAGQQPPPLYTDLPAVFAHELTPHT